MVDDTTLPTQTRTPGSADPNAKPCPTTTPALIDRFEVGQMLGRGGMGTVYEAYDPKLRRAVALKLLHRGVDADSIAGKRMIREARALAQLSHPNVVQVFGVGVDDGRVWLAMELVVGETLRQWIVTHDDASLEQRLEILSQAGRGLAAAHTEGLTHRDFKPSNVLVGEDGRVRVVDFGIAQVGTSTGSDAAEETLDERMTQTGRAVGTPRYMAPEQRRGGEVGPRSDQFAFAVTAWEVLHGERPFAGESLDAVFEAVEHGAVAQPKNGGVPSWLNAALRKAMRASPRRRFGSMQRLLNALERVNRWRRWGIAAGVSVAAAVAMFALPEATGVPVDCDRLAEERFAEHWGTQRRQRVHSGLLNTATAFAQLAPAVVDMEVEAYQRTWTDGFVSACHANGGALAHAREPGVLSCYALRLEEFDEVLSRLEVADASLVERASSVIRRLPSARLCGGDRRADDERVQASALSERLVEAHAAFAVRDYDEAAALAEAVASEAAASNWDAVHGDALALLSDVYGLLDDARARETAEAAYSIAAGAGSEMRAAQRARRIAVFFRKGGALDHAARWYRQQATHLQRAGVDPERDPEFLHDRCDLLAERGDRDRAVEACTRSIARFLAVPGATKVAAWAPRSTLATLYKNLGRSEDARRMYEQLLVEAEETLGPNHPRVGGMHLNLGDVAHQRGEQEVAIAHLVAARSIFTAVYGGGHRWVVSTFINESVYHRAQGRREDAERACREGLSRLGEKGPRQRARLLNNLSTILRETGRGDEALELLFEVQRLEAELLPAGHAQTAFTAESMCHLYVDDGRLDDALVECRRAVAIRTEANHGQTLPSTLRSLGALYLLRGENDDARSQLEAALARIELGDQRAHEAFATRVRVANIYLEEGNINAAREQLDAIDQLDLEMDVQERGWNAFVRGRLALADGDRQRAAELGKQAVEHLRDVPRLFPAPPDAQAWLSENGLDPASR